ncbi:SDR family NAD(P)-dependent oxidoreductase [Geodermatophilus maliterrae]|uniref:SDR family NAD(P)-dependent oxidoreductase n=1 Tax=Geodermatophilus maliterrae TaxID=3162531 RepID=A0ABV3XKL2_9ACTN
MSALGPFDFTAGTAVVTGAASGIGAALAPALAARGSDLVLLDRDTGRLDAVAASVRAAHPGRRVTTVLADLADAAQVQRAADTLVAEHPGTTLLVNNAGIALTGRFDQVTLAEFDEVLAVNFSAVVRLTHALLPTLKAHPGAHLVTVSSLFGLMAPAGQAAYASSKFAVRGFTEALRHELAGDGVGVTSVHPGGIRTRIAESARVAAAVPAEEAERGKRDFARLLRYPPDRAAERILTAVERRRPRLLIGASAVVPDVLVRLAPGSYGRVLAAGAALLARRGR